ncbi:hypothetical protein D3C83_106250 [compost metagenome]
MRSATTVTTVRASAEERMMTQKLLPGDSKPRVESAEPLKRKARMSGLTPTP